MENPQLVLLIPRQKKIEPYFRLLCEEYKSTDQIKDPVYRLKIFHLLTTALGFLRLYYYAPQNGLGIFINSQEAKHFEPTSGIICKSFFMIDEKK